MKPIVIKRDGCQVPFDEQRIKEAVVRAARAAGVDDTDYCATVARVVAMQMADLERVDIHVIQNAVENQLMAGNYKQLARAYIEYRHDLTYLVNNVAVLIRKSVAWLSKAMPLC